MADTPAAHSRPVNISSTTLRKFPRFTQVEDAGDALDRGNHRRKDPNIFDIAARLEGRQLQHIAIFRSTGVKEYVFRHRP